MWYSSTTSKPTRAVTARLSSSTSVWWTRISDEPKLCNRCHLRAVTNHGYVLEVLNADAFEKGEQVHRKGERVTIVKIDYQCDPPSYVVKTAAGNEVGTGAS